MNNLNGNVRAAVSEYLARGWVSVPIPPRTKRAILPKWPTLAHDSFDLNKLFPPGKESNIGLLLGAPSGGLIDIDLDAVESRAAAPYFLPKTDRKSGRGSGQPGHYWYRVENPPDKSKDELLDPIMGAVKGAGLVDLRSTGGQTIVPPSILPAEEELGKIEEPCIWFADGEPAHVELSELRTAQRRIAAAALLARYWRLNTRHDSALALAGGLLRAGWTVASTKHFIEAVCAVAGDEEKRDRVRAVHDTADNLRKEDEKTTGFPKLAKLLGEHGPKIVASVREWLSVRIVSSSSSSSSSSSKATASSTATGASADDTPEGNAARTGAEIILLHFRDTYRPVFKRGTAVIADDGAEALMNVATALPTSKLISRLEAATDAPRFANGAVKTGSLPAFFKTWAKVAWGDLLGALPDEDEAVLGADAPAREEFRRLVREAMFSPLMLGHSIDRGPLPADVRLETRPLIKWCEKFADMKEWADIRDRACWCKMVAGPTEGEIILSVAIRHELFSQLKADRRLRDMGPNTFSRRARRYGVAMPGGQGNRPHGKWVLILDPEFLRELRVSAKDVLDAE